MNSEAQTYQKIRRMWKKELQFNQRMYSHWWYSNEECPKDYKTQRMYILQNRMGDLQAMLNDFKVDVA